MRDFAEAHHIQTLDVDPNLPVNETDVRDIRSESRLRLVLDTNTATSYGWGSWKQGMEPAVLEAFPAARVVRNPGAETKRPRHAQEEGNVRLKTDYAFWADWMNAPEIGGFQTPHPPYGFNSFIDQQDVSRQEAIELQLIPRNAPTVPGSGKRQPSLNDRLRSSLAGLDKDARNRLKQELGEIAVVGPKFARMKTQQERQSDN